MMLLNPVIATIFNSSTNRWHPVVFEERPFPGGAVGAPMRHKSKGHHTIGFATQAEADAHSINDMAPKLGPCKLRLDVVIEWDGTCVPAIVQTFNFDGVPA